MAEKSPALREENSSVPGIGGVSGIVMCPKLKAPCLKSGCEWWIELMYDGQKVGRCSRAWQPILQTETRQEIENLRQEVAGLRQGIAMLIGHK